MELNTNNRTCQQSMDKVTVLSEYTVNIREVQEKHLIVKETIKTIIKLEKER